MHLLLLLHLLGVPPTTHSHSLPRLTLSLEVIWHDKVWSNTRAYTVHELLLEAIACMLRRHHARSSLTKEKLLWCKPWWNEFDIFNRTHDANC